MCAIAKHGVELVRSVLRTASDGKASDNEKGREDAAEELVRKSVFHDADLSNGKSAAACCDRIRGSLKRFERESVRAESSGVRRVRRREQCVQILRTRAISRYA